MKHRLAELLHYAAENADARFTCDYDPCHDHSIISVLRNPELNWKIKPHKWQKEREAFERGEVIEYVDHDDNWAQATHPTWNEDAVYRIKPKTVTKWLWTSEYGILSSSFHDVAPCDSYKIKLEWSATEFEEN